MDKPRELEEIMGQLEETVQKMEKEKLTLEESYQAFSAGMELVKEGNAAIDRVEKKIQVLMAEGEDHDEREME